MQAWGSCSLPVGKLTQCCVCGQDLNVAVGAMLGMRGSALPGAELEEPTTLFKEMAVRGTADRLLCFSVCLSLGSKHLFLPSTRMAIIFLCVCVCGGWGGGWLFPHLPRKGTTHAHKVVCCRYVLCRFRYVSSKLQSAKLMTF